MATIPSDIKDREAAALRELYNAHTGRTHGQFAKDVGISSGAMVWQYLSGHRPLNLDVAARFAKGLNIPVRNFSERLDAEYRAIARAIHGAPAAPITRIAREQRADAPDAWPFPAIDPHKVRKLHVDDLLRLEGALFGAANAIGVDIRKAAAA